MSSSRITVATKLFLGDGVATFASPSARSAFVASLGAESVVIASFGGRSAVVSSFGGGSETTSYYAITIGALKTSFHVRPSLCREHSTNNLISPW
jgi:hypothetical protein